MEDKIKTIENKNKEYSSRNTTLWQELCKSREREQNLEKLLIIAVTCLASINGINFFNNRELLGPGQTYPTVSSSPGLNLHSSNRNISGAAN